MSTESQILTREVRNVDRSFFLHNLQYKRPTGQHGEAGRFALLLVLKENNGECVCAGAMRADYVMKLMVFSNRHATHIIAQT